MQMNEFLRGALPGNRTRDIAVTTQCTNHIRKNSSFKKIVRNSQKFELDFFCSFMFENDYNFDFVYLPQYILELKVKESKSVEKKDFFETNKNAKMRSKNG